jgi:hypothetical protein
MRKLVLVLAVLVGIGMVFSVQPAMAKMKKVPARALLVGNRNLEAASTCTITCATTSPSSDQQFFASLSTSCDNPLDCCCKACLTACQVDQCGATDGQSTETCANAS